MLYLTRQEQLLVRFLFFSILGGALFLTLAGGSPAFRRTAAFIERTRLLKVVDINKADYDELLTVDGIGPLTARRILAERKNKGDFLSIDELKRVRGMSLRRIRQISGQIRVR